MPDREDGPGLLGDLDELVGHDRAVARVRPAHERLDAGKAARREVDDGLVEERELVEVDRTLEVDAELMALAHGLVHARVEDREAGLAVRLGHVHGDVGVADEVGRARDGVPRTRDTHGGRDHDVLLAEDVRRAELVDQSARHRARAAEHRLVLGEDRELVAAEPGDEVALTDQAADPLRHRDEELVAGGVAERVVDDLEVVEVEEEDRRHPVRPRARLVAAEDPLEGEGEHATVRGTREGVALGEVLHVLEQDRVPQVQRGDRGELAEHRGHAALDARPAPCPVLDDDRADRLVLHDHRRDEDVAGARQEAGEERVPGRVELLDRQDLAALPGSADDPVGLARGRRCIVDAVRRERDDPAVGLTQQDPALEPEARHDRRQHDIGLLDGVRDGIKAGADLDEGLQVRPALPELTLVQRREERRREREQPERGHVEHGHLLELDRDPRLHVHGGHQLRGLGVEEHDEEQRVPEGHLEPGAVRGQQRDGDQLQVHQELDRALRAAGRVHRGCEVETVDEQERGHGAVGEPARASADHLSDHRDRQVGDGADAEGAVRHDQRVRSQQRPGRDDHAHRDAQHQQVGHTVRER